MNLNIIIISQEYKTANHQYLWHSMSLNDLNNDYLIIDIPADLFITRIKKKGYRIREAKEGIKKINNNLFLIRPMFLLRPESLPLLFFPCIAKKIIACIGKELYLKKYEKIIILSYSAKWIKILKPSFRSFTYVYYLFDEVRADASTGKTNKNRLKYDIYACRESDLVFSISDALTNSRISECKRILTIGNGSNYSCQVDKKSIGYPKSFAFVGNFRSWIDKNLLMQIVSNCSDLNFYIVGNIEKNMLPFFEELLLKQNVKYLGTFSKTDVKNIYQQFDCVIIPYLQNDFIYKTRPIKIVESIFCGTPVVTIPVSGYQECSFIKFANNYLEFENQIRYFINNKIDTESKEYKSFILSNSWDTIANNIIKKVHEII